MADYAITANSVTSTGQVLGGTAGEAIAAGDWLYLKASDQKLWKAQAGGTAAEAVAVGMAANSAAAGQPISYYPTGQEIVVDNSLFVVGAFLYLSETAGKTAPLADVTENSYITQVGYATAANKLMSYIKATGLQVPAA